MKTLTIYTPTYNRATLLPRVYESLCRQTCKDFLWLVIDDGSTDNTRKLVQSWIDEKKLEIQYVYKENGGVHTARDLAYHLCETELISGCDSDDWLTDNAVELWLKCWETRKPGEYAGIFSVTVNERGVRVTGKFPKVEAISYQDFTYKYGCSGEKDSVFCKKVVAMLPDYPVYPGEKLVGEGYKWIQYPDDIPFLLLDRETRVYEQQSDGYIKGVAASRFKNPNGFRAVAKQHIISSKYLKPRLKGHLSYIAFSIILKDKQYIKDSPKPLITLLLTPFGFAVYLRFLYQKKRADHAGK